MQVEGRIRKTGGKRGESNSKSCAWFSIHDKLSLFFLQTVQVSTVNAKVVNIYLHINEM